MGCCRIERRPALDPLSPVRPVTQDRRSPTLIGQTLAHYRVTAAIGAGGMGEVYRATDTKLGREVALKLLPAEVSQDAERLARFEREAKVLAALNHPGIAHVYGFESATLGDGSIIRFLAMELVEGEDLALRLKRGRVPLDEALAIARQIAEALESAHEKGIIHRDLKPANVKITPDGLVKVLDFGLAKAWAGEGPGVTSSPDLSRSPTLAQTGTAAGLILGTAAYMSPEQARGKPVDKKADIWAFGVVLWEMLTGRRLFEGETLSDVLAAVLKTAPDLDALPTGVPPRVRGLLGRCLRKDPKQRLHDIADARIELAEEEERAPDGSGVASPRRASAVVPWAVAVLAVAAAAAWTLLGGRPAETPAPQLKVAVLPPSGTVSSGPIDLSPDGRRIAFTAVDADSQARLYVRDLDDLAPKALPGTEGAEAPFFSPDGRSVGFFAGGRLKRIDLAGGPARELADAPDHRGGSWGSQGLIVFAPEGGGPIWRNLNTDGLTAFSVAEGGTLAYRGGGLVQRQLTWLDRQGRTLGTVGPPGILGSLDLSPDDRRVLAEIIDPVRDTSALFVLDGATGTSTRVTLGTGNQSSGLFSPDGRSFAFSWDTEGAFDLYRREVGSAAEPSPLLVNGVWKFPDSWSPDGRFLSYTQSEPGRPRDLWILPVTGEAGPFPIAQTPAEESGSAFSPDGRFLAFVSDESGRSEVFVRTFPAATRKWQVSTGGGDSPVWRADGSELFYLTPDRTLVAVPIALAAGGLEPGTPRPLFRNPDLRLPTIAGGRPYEVTADGQRFLAIVTVGEAESSPIVLQTGARP